MLQLACGFASNLLSSTDATFLCSYGYPAFVAVNPKDKKYASLREAFNYDNARHFIESLRSVSQLSYHLHTASALSIGFTVCDMTVGT